VGEIRDSETAQIAVQSALTGHLVFTTVHANNVMDVIGRFLNMGLEPYHFLSSLIMDRRPAGEIYGAAKTGGTELLREVALGKARTGVTTMGEINRVTFAE